MSLTMDAEDDDRAEPTDERAEPTDERAEPTDDRDDASYGHLDDLADGAGCTEIWEHLSDSREE
ncbi:hypothetical protein [Halobellus sp. GM3]|uniref:hypothetical protein n=1 Tax=Halobellus sp. GM3 TaxID=3458410 RepID=UPI00403DC0C4